MKKALILSFIAAGLLAYGIYVASKKICGAAAAVAAVAIFAAGWSWLALFPLLTLLEGIYMAGPWDLPWADKIMSIYPRSAAVTSSTFTAATPPAQ